MIVGIGNKAFAIRLTVVGIVLMIVALLVGLCIVRPIMVTMKLSERRLVRLLCETDYQVLLESCRELANRVAQGDLKPGTYTVRMDPDPEVSHFPQVILSIEPAYVAIENDGRVILEMQGFPSHGVVACPEDYQVGAGDIELVPGLWYYDEDYDNNQDLKQYIDSLVEKGRNTIDTARVRGKKGERGQALDLGVARG